MPSNPLFWIVLAIAAVGYVATLVVLYSSDGDAQRGFHSGRTPGYSYTEGHNVGLDESVVDLPDGDWMPLRLETLHSPERSRLILQIDFETKTEANSSVRAFLLRLAEEVQTRAEADVVLVEAMPRRGTSEGRWEQLYAPDGRGWSGSEQIHRAFRSPETSARLE